MTIPRTNTEMSMQIKAVIFGASGMVGEGVLHEALRHSEVVSVLVIGRRSCEIRHEKLREVVTPNLYDLSSLEGQFTGYNACYFCLGTTSVGKKEDEYRRITYDLTLHAARTLSRLNPDMTFCYISGLGTDSSEQGKSMWARVKGKTENDLMKLPFKAAFMLRPGFIRPMAGLKRSHSFARVLIPLYPFLHTVASNYVCTLEDVGRSMINVTRLGYQKRVLACEDIDRCARGEV